jgi:hypothetical protein
MPSKNIVCHSWGALKEPPEVVTAALDERLAPSPPAQAAVAVAARMAR